MKNPKFVFELLDYIAECDLHDSLYWKTAKDELDIVFWVDVSDVFWWACADCEEITTENFEEFKKAVKDCDEAHERVGIIHAPDLFAARMRKLRPQGQCIHIMVRAFGKRNIR